MVSPVLKRRNESFVWQYMKKYENKIVCQVINCSEEFSIKTSSSSLAVHLANIHEINELKIILGKQLVLKVQENTFVIKTKFLRSLSILFIADNTKFRKLIFSLNPRFVLPDRKIVREMIKRKY
ncbi:zinc finger BED domain-containing 4-like isoform X2 [Brachionus plicatilis]|uniref:Zinc finger BED domain-containing 4-like isoform X2 n=1 Tax=Brachionus plicatilis TaxID=10195 RepID=A0A3M7RDJ7_BRAPC|nr:zinc finger BED domain-containing 4-like isoform X2 [Brachionus plicatilis]